jgi:hypothetical protein
MKPDIKEDGRFLLNLEPTATPEGNPPEAGKTTGKIDINTCMVNTYDRLQHLQ